MLQTLAPRQPAAYAASGMVFVCQRTWPFDGSMSRTAPLAVYW
jgi:hypothetical protein